MIENHKHSGKTTFHLRFWMVWLIVIGIASVSHSQEMIIAGTTEENITPPVGFPHYRGYSTGINDSLYAKTFYLRQGDQEIAIVECDLLWVSREVSSNTRLRIADELGIPFTHVLIAGTHSHTSPAYDEDILELNEHLRSGQVSTEVEKGVEYTDWLSGKIVASVQKAKANSVESVLSVGSVEINDLSFNRRYIMADGRVKTNPGILNPEALYPEGPIDPEVGIIVVKNSSGNQTGGFINFSNHTDTKGGKEFSADFPAYVSQALKANLGDDFVSIYGQGPCGNLNHVDIRTRDRLTSEQIGKSLAEGVLGGLDGLKDLQGYRLATNSEIVYAPLQHFTPEELQWANQMDPENLYGESDFFKRRRPMKIRSLDRMRKNEAVPPTVPSGEWKIPLEVQVFQIHPDLAIVGLPGEVFVQLGLAIKEASPYKHTMVLELTNSHIAYVPTKEAFSRGGYETINSRLAPGGGEMMVESAIRLLKELKKR